MTANNASQVREIRAGNNYLSQNPLEAHFGMATATTADIDVLWPDGLESHVSSAAIDQLLQVARP